MSDDPASALAQHIRCEFRRRLIGEQLPRITRCAQLLDDDRIWLRPSQNTNSVGNLILHLVGNTTQWILAEFSDLEDLRQRDQEFSTQGGHTVTELIAMLSSTYTRACDTVDSVSLDQLLAKRTVQGYTETGVSVILHVLEHSSNHAGQIYAWTKQTTGIDLAFYDL